MGFHTPWQHHLKIATLVLIALLIVPSREISGEDEKMHMKMEKQRYDGWYNNLAHPQWGAIDSTLTRKTPPSYADGVYMMAGENRPSPRTITEMLMKGADGQPSKLNRTALFAFFGQVVSSEIMMASEGGCPIEIKKIEIERCDHMYDKSCKGNKYMPFHRAGYKQETGQSPNNPREQINSMTSWIDGSFVYSTSEPWVNCMRGFVNGTLRSDSGGVLPVRNEERVPLMNQPSSSNYFMTKNPERMFLLGDPRSNQNPALLAFSILFFKYHNALAQEIQIENPHWSDEEIFQKARRMVTASLQNIIAYEFIPALIQEELDPYSGYKAEVHPGVSHVFQSAAFRFSHTLIPPGLYRRNGQCEFRKTTSGMNAIRLCSTWWGSEEFLTEDSFEELLMGMASQISEREDATLCSDVKDKLFGPLDFTRRDLGALNIMRGRDNGLPDYNLARKCFNLPMISNWSAINPELAAERPEVFKDLSSIYKSIDNIDLYVGGMLETTDGPGPLFTKIIKSQFQNIRDADRFWFENKQTSIFTDEEIEKIKKIRLYDVILKSTDISPDAIQEDVFFWSEGDPCQQPEQLSGRNLDECVAGLDSFDYFSGSEVAYIYSCITLAFIPIVVASLGYAVVKLQNKRRRKLKMKREENNNAKTYDKVYVREWLHQNHKRWVKIKFGPDESFSVVNRKSVVLRKISFKTLDTLVVQVTQDTRRKPMILVQAARDYDLVLEFDNMTSRKKFLTKLENFLISHHKGLETISSFRDPMLANAETKERRQKRLEHFFREAYALTFGLKPGERRHLEEVSSDVIMVMRTSLSKKEFAEALGMKPDSLFVKQMFNCVDKDGDGRISFQEFLDTIVLFTKGKTDNKLRIIFDMCDNDGNGMVDKQEFANMLHSLVDIAKTNSLTDQQTKDLIQGMFAAAGLEDKDELSYEDFKLVMKEYKGDFIAIGLDCKGARQNFLDTSTNVARMTSFQIDHVFEDRPSWWSNTWDLVTTILEEYRQHIFYLFVFYVITIGLFFERFFYYLYMSEHKDLRHVMGAGIAVTRGSAASLTFAYSILLLTICRNLITKLQELPIHQYIPLTSNIQFHKCVALTALFFTVMHTIGHIINFYHLSTQPIEHLHCLSGEIRIDSHTRPTISYWLFRTVTGISGVLLYTVVCFIFIFAHPEIRNKAYKYFWATHSLYVLLYVLCIIHGLGRLTGTPRFWMFFIGPGILFALDRVISIQTKFMELDILGTDLLPSDVTMVKFYRPPNFKYLSGQWVRLSCTTFRSSEYHSLTLTSAPHENYLSVHIKAKGPWTWKLRNYFDPSNLNDGPLPKIRLEGPFGCGNQDWYKFEVAVMVGGGIGVTPYASILNDLVFGTSTNRYSGVACKKVYFLWICPQHRHFEWFIDVLRDVEKKDVTNVLEMHIFITQFFHKFDLRTTMLYICENHFQRISGKSMFTGLKAVNHFGRPDMSSFLKFVQKKHSYISKVGVFSCGPSAMTKSVTKACESVNKTRKLPYFIHHFENFG